VRFLWEHLGIEKEKVVVAGDSGNDYSLFDTPFNGIIPANSIDSLGAVANKPHHYHSRYAAGAGVLDGLCRFGYLKMA
jgi:hydroxymethylpyrimidine pyrophosphatase-like HAD family hydrolase